MLLFVARYVGFWVNKLLSGFYLVTLLALIVNPLILIWCHINIVILYCQDIIILFLHAEIPSWPIERSPTLQAFVIAPRAKSIVHTQYNHQFVNFHLWATYLGKQPLTTSEPRKRLLGNPERNSKIGVRRQKTEVRRFSDWLLESVFLLQPPCSGFVAWSLGDWHPRQGGACSDTGGYCSCWKCRQSQSAESRLWPIP